ALATIPLIQSLSLTPPLFYILRFCFQTCPYTPSTTPTWTNTPTFTPIPTFTPTFTPLPTNTPIFTLIPTITNTPTMTPTPVEHDTIGIFRASSGTFYLRNSNSTGYADISVAFNPASTPYLVTGNWVGGSGSGDTIGVFDQANGLFSLRNSNTAGAPDTQFVLGNPGDQPLSGHWTSTMAHDGVGAFRPSNGVEFFLKNSLGTGYADYAEVLGIPGDLPLSGDWSGNGSDSPGIYRPSNNTFYLSNQVCNCSVFANYTFSVTGGGNGYVPIAGDWIGQGHDGVGLFNAAVGKFLLKNQLTSGAPDNGFVFGGANDIPVAGQWSSH
ncbi:MAG: hypothetical protein ACYDBJ_28350, partial [Aggregatilineales bacterium]